MKRCLIIEVNDDPNDIALITHIVSQNLVDYIVLNINPNLEDEYIQKVYRQIQEFKKPIRDMIVPKTKIVYCATSLTKVADYIEKNHRLEWLFCDSKYLYADIYSSEYVLQHDDSFITNVIMIIQEDHDRCLIASEALKFLSGTNTPDTYKPVRMFVNTALNRQDAVWYTEDDEDSNVRIANQLALISKKNI